MYINNNRNLFFYKDNIKSKKKNNYFINFKFKYYFARFTNKKLIFFYSIKTKFENKESTKFTKNIENDEVGGESFKKYIFFFLKNYLFLYCYNYCLEYINRSFIKINDWNNKRRFFTKKYLYTINHKRLGLNYFYFSMVTALAGSILATMIRLEMSIPGSFFFKGDSVRYLQVMSAHALIMIFFVVVPIFFGGFANFLLPYHVGSKDVAFPRLNSLGFWIQPCGFLLVAKLGFLKPQFWRYNDKIVYYSNMSNNNILKKSNLLEKYMLDVLLSDNNKYNYTLWNQNFKLDMKFINNLYDGNPLTYISNKLWDINSSYNYSNNYYYLAVNNVKLKRKKRSIPRCSNSTMTVSGWTFITPFSSNTKYTGVGSQDLLILGVIFVGISTTISLTNLLVTRRVLIIPGLKNRRVLLPFFSITILLMFRVLAVITPILGAGMIMLLLDRHWSTSFFDFSYGGDPILFQHLFWFFGHPEVYVLIIPAFGLINEILAFNNFRRVASKHHMIWAVYIMTYMGFLVWGHHMYLIGLDHRSRSLYSTITIMISLPATIKVVNWTFTLANGMLLLDAALFASIFFLFFFIVAGFTGMWLSHVSLNITMHDTFYVVAHFHIMLSGSAMMAIFAGFYYYYITLFGLKFSRILSYLHLIYYGGGQWFIFLPMFWLGFSGLPRRVHDFPYIFMGWQSMSTVGLLVTLIGVFFFYSLLADSSYEKKTIKQLVSGIPRLNKRANYYFYKIFNLNELLRKFSFLANFNVRSFIIKSNRNINFFF